MPYHVLIWPQSEQQQTLKELYAFNLDEAKLRERFIEPYEYGEPITSEGRTLAGGDISYVKITETGQPIPEGVTRGFQRYDAWKSGMEVTDDLITVGPGSRARPGHGAEVAPAAPATTPDESAQSRIVQICRRFQDVADQLARRHNGRDTVRISDEYDVQDVLHALLRIDFDDVRDEEHTPSYAGKETSRIDFILKREQIAVEVKFAREGHAEKDIGDELLIDQARYAEHGDVKVLICFVHDPKRVLKNARGFESDLTGPYNHLQTITIVA